MANKLNKLILCFVLAFSHLVWAQENIQSQEAEPAANEAPQNPIAHWENDDLSWLLYEYLFEVKNAEDSELLANAIVAALLSDLEQFEKRIEELQLRIHETYMAGQYRQQQIFKVQLLEAKLGDQIKSLRAARNSENWTTILISSLVLGTLAGTPAGQRITRLLIGTRRPPRNTYHIGIAARGAMVSGALAGGGYFLSRDHRRIVDDIFLERMIVNAGPHLKSRIEQQGAKQ